MATPPSTLPARLSDPNAPNLSAQVPGTYELRGEIAQTVSVTLEHNQSMWASKGALMAYDDGVQWQLKIPGAAVSRMLSGEGLAMTYVTALRPGARVVLSANQTGKIAVWDLRWGPVTCTSGAFLGALGDVKIDVTVARRFGAALFGGAGLLLQQLSGTGIVFLHGAGDFVERDLQPGESITVSTGNLAAFGSGVGYDIVGVGGCLKIIFGREGLFMTKMTGPGRVLLQSMKRIRLPQGRGQR
jgi:uncharacterized protein (AIM24 family)